MAGVTSTNAKLFLPIVQTLVDTVREEHPIFSMIPFRTVANGYTYVYNVATSDGGAGNPAINAASIDAVSGVNTQPVFARRTRDLVKVMGTVEMDRVLANRASWTDYDALAAYLAQKMNGVARTVQEQMVSGDGASGKMSGLDAYISSGEYKLEGTKEGLTFANLTSICFALDCAEERKVLLTNLRAKIKIFDILQGLNGASINETIQLPGGRRVIGLFGTPLFTSQTVKDRTHTFSQRMQSGNVSDTTSIYAIALASPGSTPTNEGCSFIVPPNPPLGISLQNFDLEDIDSTRTRIVWDINFVVHGKRSAAVLQGVVS